MPKTSLKINSYVDVLEGFCKDFRKYSLDILKAYIHIYSYIFIYLDQLLLRRPVMGKGLDWYTQLAHLKKEISNR